jgi:DNA-binding LacI/PurR family transcriptional regulator
VSIAKVAQFAGVSTSTVSRVINAHPSVAPATKRSVREAIEHLGFTPLHKKIGRGEAGSTGKPVGTLGFFVLGADGARPAPGFFRLLQGVTAASEKHGVNVAVSFVSDLSQVPGKIEKSHFDGLLLHGELPPASIENHLKRIPSVWLMANRQRPTWGDQVMPENIVVGELAAWYLTQRGHRHLAYVGVGCNSWFVGVRILAFEHAAAEKEAAAIVLTIPESPADRLGQAPISNEIGEAIVDRLMQIAPKTTGLFVAEDRMLPAIYTALGRRGISIGPDKDIEIISCNYEQPHFLNLRPNPASIDIRPEAIGECGVNRLLWKIRHPDSGERMKIMIEPIVIEPAASLPESPPESETNHIRISVKQEELV